MDLIRDLAGLLALVIILGVVGPNLPTILRSLAD